MMNGITPLSMQGINSLPEPAGSSAKPQVSQFGDMLKSALNEVNRAQVESDKMTGALAKGQNIELQDVMIAAEKASITLLSAVEMRNKAIEAYQEIMRMQM
ncbi:flagellar hook-basal body complex protein FliE [Bacillus sp. FJAT-42376]|uniref:flagellar hook-basal body complex protein FliE n=1 Tax=Bacillus sp. FJAT-42376 TaxID=2014076 RepID=UPI000F4F9930|nr:flagellar hook-basal body complex protein FliE [Bacillus sp. FJAT-42376]AZB42936.1 flagellar hook-basal body complex protein FliE [Bacillus sp. FJAT-42376]